MTKNWRGIVVVGVFAFQLICGSGVAALPESYRVVVSDLMDGEFELINPATFDCPQYFLPVALSGSADVSSHRRALVISNLPTVRQRGVRDEDHQIENEIDRALSFRVEGCGLGKHFLPYRAEVTLQVNGASGNTHHVVLSSDVSSTSFGFEVDYQAYIFGHTPPLASLFPNDLDDRLVGKMEINIPSDASVDTCIDRDDCHYALDSVRLVIFVLESSK